MTPAVDIEIHNALETLCNLERFGNTGIYHLVDAIQSRHRTRQQIIIGVLVNALVKYADAPHDLRNQAAVELCQDIRYDLDDRQKLIRGAVALPFI